MDDEKAQSRNWLYVSSNAEDSSNLASITIDGEMVNLPERFDATVETCRAEGNDHLSLACQDGECADFAGRLEIAAAMGKEILFLHAKVAKDELDAIKDLIDVGGPRWHEVVPEAKSWTVYPYRCDCDGSNGHKKKGMFSLAPGISTNGVTSS